MFGEGARQLREQLKHKRSREGLEEIPPDLFAKKAKAEMSEEEFARMMERRKRNKEAAEKSRKKKKTEFEKLQIENDQLNQDKCELVAMVEKLKADNDNIADDNETLRTSLDQLKRWIGKRATELGLEKYARKDVVFVTDDKMLVSPPKTPSPSLTQRGDVSLPKPRPQLEMPWLVDQPMSVTTPLQQDHITFRASPLSTQHAVHVGEPQAVLGSEGQRIICLPKVANDAIIIVQQDIPVMTAVPGPRPHNASSPKFGAEPPRDQRANTPGSVRGHGQASPDLTPADHSETREGSAMARLDPETVTAIESLLRLGYKIRKPEDIQTSQPVSPSASQPAQPASPTRNGDQVYEAPAGLRSPSKAAEAVGVSTSAVEVLTVPGAGSQSSVMVSSMEIDVAKSDSAPTVHCRLQRHTLQELLKAGYSIQTLPARHTQRLQD